MRMIEKDLSLEVDGQKMNFRLKKPDAFSGMEILRLLIRLQDQRPEAKPTVVDLVFSFSSDELKSVMMACLNHVYVLLPAGPNPVMTQNEWTFPEIQYDLKACLSLLIEEIAWTLEGFFAAGGSISKPASPNIAQQNV